MSAGYRQRFQGSIEYEIWQHIAEVPGLTSSAVASAFPKRPPESVHRALRSLRAKGVIYNDGLTRERQAWSLTQWGEECLRNKLIVSRGKHGEGPHTGDPSERDWKPQPWVHPIRARALGLPISGRRSGTDAS